MMTMVQGRESVQRNGIVFVFYHTAPNPAWYSPSASLQFSPSATWGMMNLRRALPVRFSARHFCIYSKSSFFNVAYSMFYKLNPSADRVRFQLHCGKKLKVEMVLVKPLQYSDLNQSYPYPSFFRKGSDKECMRELQRFGLPTESFPVTESGDVKPESHRKWLQKRREIEDRQQETVSTPCPSPSLSIEATPESNGSSMLGHIRGTTVPQSPSPSTNSVASSTSSPITMGEAK